MFITDENRGRTVSGGHGIIAQKSISEIVTLHKKLMYYNKNIRGTCNSIHFRYNVLDGYKINEQKRVRYLQCTLMKM